MLLANLSRNAVGKFQGNPYSWQFCVRERGEKTEDSFLHGFAANLSVHKKGQGKVHTNTVEDAKTLSDTGWNQGLSMQFVKSRKTSDVRLKKLMTTP